MTISVHSSIALCFAVTARRLAVRSASQLPRRPVLSASAIYWLSTLPPEPWCPEETAGTTPTFRCQSLSGVTPGPNGTTFFPLLHHWVTESDDTIFLADADAANYTISSDPNYVLAVYRNGVEITGGTGRFDGAAGTVSCFGAIDGG